MKLGLLSKAGLLLNEGLLSKVGLLLKEGLLSKVGLLLNEGLLLKDWLWPGPKKLFCCGAGLPKPNLGPRKELKGACCPPNLWLTAMPKKSGHKSNSLILTAIGCTLSAPRARVPLL